MKHMGESRKAYRRSNTLRYLKKIVPYVDALWRVSIKERRRCKDGNIPISQAKGQRKQRHTYVSV
jgi:hypothetical protein